MEEVIPKLIQHLFTSMEWLMFGDLRHESEFWDNPSG